MNSSPVNIACINEALPHFNDKYDFIDEVFRFNQKSNPSAHFHYITDQAVKIKGASTHDIAQYTDRDTKALEANFLNLNSVPKELELSWVKRWVILRNFMSKHSLKSVLYLDNDVLLFTPISTWPQEVKKADYSLSENCSPHTNYINNFLALDKFVDYILDIYVNRNFELDKFKSIYKKMQASKRPGGVGDMMLWTHFSNKHLFPGAIMDISKIFDHNQSFDHNIHTTKEIWAQEAQYKKIILQNSQPYGQRLSDGKLIKFNTLHFQGGAKSKMHQYL